MFKSHSQQPLDFIATAMGFYAAYQIQKWGWQLQAKRLVIKTLDAIETSVQASKAETATE